MIGRAAAAGILAAAVLVQPAAAKTYIALSTRQAGPMIAWYKAAFDLTQVRTVRPQGANATVTILDGPLVTVEILARGDLMAMGPSPERRIGIYKTGFTVDDLDPWVARWRQAGVALAGPYTDAAAGSRTAILNDPDGNMIQITAPLTPP